VLASANLTKKLPAHLTNEFEIVMHESPTLDAGDCIPVAPCGSSILESHRDLSSTG
jgi:hypothetical protein